MLIMNSGEHMGNDSIILPGVTKFPQWPIVWRDIASLFEDTEQPHR